MQCNDGCVYLAISATTVCSILSQWLYTLIRIPDLTEGKEGLYSTVTTGFITQEFGRHVNYSVPSLPTPQAIRKSLPFLHIP
jgi:hypothetical protein